jgi:hypothetical protein
MFDFLISRVAEQTLTYHDAITRGSTTRQTPSAHHILPRNQHRHPHNPELRNVTLQNTSHLLVRGLNTHSRWDIPIPMPLPRLTSITVTVPGSGDDVLAGIDAPARRDLHLDGFCRPLLSHLIDIDWSSAFCTEVPNTLQQLVAIRSQVAQTSPDRNLIDCRNLEVAALQ